MINRIIQNLSEYVPRTLNTELPQAAVLIPITHTKSPEVILTRRATHLTTHGGEVALPGGKREPDDHTLNITALRESHEEINLLPSDVTVVGQTGSVISRFGLEVTPFVGIIPEHTTLKANANEIDKIFRVPLSFFLEQEMLRLDQWKVGKKSYRMPAFQYEDYLIWGLTAIIISEFVNITLGANIPLDVPQFSASFSNCRQINYL